MRSHLPLKVLLVSAAGLIAACGARTDPGAAGSAPATTVQEARRPSPWPHARGYASLTYASGIDRVLMVGGSFGAYWGTGLEGFGGVWTFDAETRRWSLVTASNPRVVDVAAYDRHHGRLLAWTSYAPADLQNPDLWSVPAPLAETWELDPRSGEWTNRMPAASPPSIVTGGQAVYDSRNDKFILVLGALGDTFFAFLNSCLTDAGCDWALYGQATSNDVWAYDYRSNRWERRQTAVSPPPRDAHSLAYDEAAGRVILFGGGGTEGDLDDTWAYDYASNTWEEMHPAVHPSARHHASFAYDRENGVAVLFGGIDPTESVASDETWTYSYKRDRWTQKHPPVSPSARAWHDMAYSEEGHAVVMFGGGPDRGSYSDETWMYRAGPDRWVQVTR